LGKVLPVDTHNVSNRIFKPLSAQLGFRINWHRVRHTHATWTDEMMIDGHLRASMMGHASERMTARYTHPFERQRQIAEAIAERIFGAASPDGKVQ
jgi:integrase